MVYLYLGLSEPKRSLTVYKYVLATLAALMLGGCASYTATSGQVVIKDDDTSVNVRIGNRDRAFIEDYYKKSAKHNKGLPQGLAKRDKLPPGLQGDPLPYDLEKQLTRLSSSYVRVRIGQDIVLMDRKTRVMVDVVYGVAD
jgi:protein involved in sex pheromone biosynthesis